VLPALHLLVIMQVTVSNQALKVLLFDAGSSQQLGSTTSIPSRKHQGRIFSVISFLTIECSVTAVRFGIQTVAPAFFGGSGPDFVVSGPNVGTNLGSGSNGPTGSGTVGAACEAAKEGFPSVAFSGSGGSQVSFTTLTTSSSSTTTADVFGALGVRFVEALLGSGATPILPAGVTLNVNYKAATGSCTSASAFDFVLTRVTTATSNTPADVSTCGTTRLPTEANVVNNMSGCLASVSVMNATTKVDVSASTQAFVLNKLGSFLSCV